MKEKIVIVGQGSEAFAALSKLMHADDIVVISPDQVKDINVSKIQEIPVVIKAPSPLATVTTAHNFDEPKNYINGKKLPNKKK